ncbi:MAG TPA: hydantoinase B/oxoprolinase family protein [Candidatus Binatia bacterium]|nr:hydantoinase B/oxoprolinase family protein [Candidatus Binatia bacterium]
MVIARRKLARGRAKARRAGAITRPLSAGPRRRPGAVDPVTAEIIRGFMETVAFEMATHVSLTATTPILNQSNERNATILDARGCLAALSVGIPQFMLSSTLPVKFALDFFGREGLFEGDVLVANDPYHGGGHLPDYNIFAPVFHEGEMVLVASIQCHHADTGGGAPGGYNVDAPDIWAEGVRFPAVKIFERGVERKDVTYMMAVNNRTPTFLGDLRAQVGAAQIGARRLKELCERYGNETVRAAVDYMVEYAKRRFKAEVASWPDGVYESDVYVDHDPKGNRDIHVHCKVTIDGSDLTVDFTGSDDRPEIVAYSTFGNTRGYVVAQLAAMMDPDIPKNEGFFDSIELIVPEGCCLNPPAGRSVAAGTHHPGTEVGEAIAKALSNVVPTRCCPQIYKMGMPTVIFGTNPRTGKTFIDHSVDTFAAYCGAVKGQDGWGAMNVSFGNLIRATAEINESIFPIRQLARDYDTDSGGAGEYRGGCGSVYRKQVLAPATVYTYVVGKRYPMPGIAGGHDGSPNQLLTRVAPDGGDPGCRGEVGEMSERVQHAAGECYEYHYGGGGGWGDPLKRPAEKVLEDVLDEYVSVEAARREYAVVLTGSLEDWTLAIDHAATEALRAERRAAS